MESKFVRGLGLFDSTMIVAGSMIGSGIFIVSADIARQVGAPGWLLMESIKHAAEDRVGTAAAGMIFGDKAAAIMISTFGCTNGLILAGARVYYAMAQHGLFFKKIGELNEHGVPANGLILQGIWASALAFSGTYGDLLDYVIFAALLFYVLTVAGIFVLRRKRPAADRPYKAWDYPVLPALYILLAMLIMIDLLIYKPTYTWPGLLLVLTGLPVYFLWRRTQNDNRGFRPPLYPSKKSADIDNIFVFLPSFSYF